MLNHTYEGGNIDLITPSDIVCFTTSKKLSWENFQGFSDGEMSIKHADYNMPGPDSCQIKFIQLMLEQGFITFLFFLSNFVEVYSTT